MCPTDSLAPFRPTTQIRPCTQSGRSRYYKLSSVALQARQEDAIALATEGTLQLRVRLPPRDEFCVCFAFHIFVSSNSGTNFRAEIGVS